MCKFDSIKELDALPDGTLIEILDRRGTTRFKRDGDWFAVDKAAPQNVFTYVNTRRYGARVIREGN
ncbi:hypothetical protein [Streptomyces sp. NPDC002547]